MAGRALVLGAGGMSGVAWEAGLLVGLAEAGVDPGGFDFVVGTSSGAIVAAALGGDTRLTDLYDRQCGPGSPAMKRTMQIDVPELDRRLTLAVDGARDGTEMRRRMGELARREQPLPADEFRALIAAELPADTWPEQRVGMVAVDTESGEPRILERAPDLPLADVVAASCAIPGVWPAVPLGDRTYMDAGTRSNENLDLVTGFERVVVLSPCGVHAPSLWMGVSLRRAMKQLRADGCEVLVVEPDLDTGDHIRANLLDPTAGAPAARAGRAQAGEVAGTVADFLG
ncbi:NTE family protein [Amycolatopsis arida]|uniref:NTE family protein n=1 Tax=Amycolatopsis arida TaxID=587909 RepID=A0A1I5P0X1_9PSEU|nr:patatin-like phospholipase family protein [Amycolatopsis arida]TDX98316.1 NTE family protein [Amycolatopsis arida]SFP27758.1 NTE family protein [Amycolatopsis arida]